MDFKINVSPETAGWFASAVGAAALAFSEIRKRFKRDAKDISDQNVAIARNEAEADVVQLLREEVARLSEANRQLLETVEQLRAELMEYKQKHADVSALYERILRGKQASTDPD